MIIQLEKQRLPGQMVLYRKEALSLANEMGLVETNCQVDTLRRETMSMILRMASSKNILLMVILRKEIMSMESDMEYLTGILQLMIKEMLASFNKSMHMVN